MVSNWSTQRSTSSPEVTQKTCRFHIDERSRDHLGLPSIVRIEIVHADDGWEATFVLDVD